MYLGEFCKEGKPCVAVRPGNRVVWNGRDLKPEGILGPNVYLANDWEIEAPKVTKVINWPEGTWGYIAGHRVYRANGDYAISHIAGGPFVFRVTTHTGTVDPKAKEETKACQ